MSFAWYLTFHDRARSDVRVSDADFGRVASIVRAAPGLARACLFTPQSSDDPYSKDGPGPQLVVQLEFARLDALENALGPDGALQPLGRADTLPSLAGIAPTQQAMALRTFTTPDPVFRTPPGAPCCSYLVTYPGPAADRNAWVYYYVSHHQPVMATFEGIREIEIATRIEWCTFLPVARVDAMLRNRVVFDDNAALNASLKSPVRERMREDFLRFPPFEGGNTHFAMATTVLRP